MIDQLIAIIGRKVERLFLVVWPPFGESDITQMDISAGFVFENEPDVLLVISTDKDDLTTPCVSIQTLPKRKYEWKDFETRINKWMKCSEGMNMDTEYYEVTNVDLFSSFISNDVRDIELVKISYEDSPLGVKLIFENDFMLSTPIIDGNTIETTRFNQNNNLDNFKNLGVIEFESIKNGKAA